MAQVVRRTTKSGEARYDVRTRVGGRTLTRTFRRRRDADAYASMIEAEKLRGTAIDPRLGRITVDEWCRSWLALRSDLRPTTRRMYTDLIRLHIAPSLGAIELGKLTPSLVRTWHARISVEHHATAARAYQVLRVSLYTAVEDGVIAVNPCKVKGAGEMRSAERPVASIAEVAALADAIPAEWRAFVLLAFWCSLRLGELRGLKRKDIDLLHGWVDVREQVVDVGGRLITGPTKTDAGRRRVAIPPHVLPEIDLHLARWVGPEREAYLFTGSDGAAPLPSATWNRAWNEARKVTGLGHLRLHDLRHAGNTLPA